jgi:CO/xanthine dehydrogenase Mo-binding subunit
MSATMTQAMLTIDRAVKPVGGLPKATGTALYASDVHLPGLLHVRTLRSPHAHARIADIDTSAVERMAGVHAVLTHRNVPHFMVGEKDGERQDKALLEEVVRYVGDEVAVVAAESEEIADDAMARIRVSYEVLPAVFDAREALKPGAPKVRPDGNIARVPGTNMGNPIMGRPVDRLVDTEWGPLKPTYLFERGDLEAGLAEAEAVVERDFHVSPVHGASLEPRGCVAHWEGNKLTVWDSTQKPYTVQTMLAKLFAVPPEDVRVIATYLGGGFGSKENLQRYQALAALLAHRTGRPVKYWLSRQEEFQCTWTRYECDFRIKLGARRDGSLTALYIRNIANQGNAIYQNTFPVRVSGHQAQVLYNRCANQRFEGYCVYTNCPSAGGTRGFGRPELLFALESAMDELANKLGIDPVELRLKNIVRSGDDLGNGFTVSSVALDKCLTESRSRIGWSRRDPNPSGDPGPVKRGIGMAAAIHSGGNTFLDTESEIELTDDGAVLLKLGIPDHGTEQETTQKLYVAQELGIPAASIQVAWADTATCPHDFGIFSSSSTCVKGAATVEAARNFKSRLLDAASLALDLVPERLSIAADRVQVIDEPVRFVSFRKLAQLTGNDRVRARGRPNMPRNVGLFSFASNFVEVEVDTRTGAVRVLKVIVALDVGQVINPMLFEAQTRAATVQGLSFALFERMRFDQRERGMPMNGGLLDYKLPSILDTPEIECVAVDSYEPIHPYGAKGAGELAMNPTVPAVCNAIYNAVGVRPQTTPVTPEALLRLIEAKAAVE